MSKEAMQMALAALEESNSLFCAIVFEKRPDDEIADQIIANRKQAEALRAALAQHEPEPEPAAWWGKVFESSQPRLVTQLRYRMGSKANKQWIPLYTAPPHRKPLTDDEMFAVFDKWSDKPETTMADLCRAVEAAHGIGEVK